MKPWHFWALYESATSKHRSKKPSKAEVLEIKAFMDQVEKKAAKK